MKKRIFGAEFEFGTFPAGFISKNSIVDKPNSRMVFNYAPLSRPMRRRITEQERLDIFLVNEARLYFDTNWHLEYCTPETARPRDLVRWEKAGERIVETIAEKINTDCQINQQYWHLGGVSFLKNNADPEAEASWGCHQNYLTERGLEMPDIDSVLAPFLISAPIWNGSGKVLYSPKSRNPAFQYILSQRMHFMQYRLGANTTRDRAMINTRDEPHADKGKWRRLEIICNDSHMSEVVSYLDYSLIGLMLEMIEKGFLKPQTHRQNFPNLDNSWYTIKIGMNADVTLKEVFTINGKFFRALDIQRMYFEEMRRYERSEGLDEEQENALDKFEALLGRIESAIASDEPEKELFSICDWAAKLAIIKNDASLHGYTLGEGEPVGKKIEFVKNTKSRYSTVKDRVLFLDIAFHDTRRRCGLHYALERNGLRERLLSEDEVVSAMTAPPSDTRAAWRKSWQDRAEKEGLIITSWNWDAVHVDTKYRWGSNSPGAPPLRVNNDPFRNRMDEREV